jgi:hypothetical protein
MGYILSSQRLGSMNKDNENSQMHNETELQFSLIIISENGN